MNLKVITLSVLMNIPKICLVDGLHFKHATGFTTLISSFVDKISLLTDVIQFSVTFCSDFRQ